MGAILAHHAGLAIGLQQDRSGFIDAQATGIQTGDEGDQPPFPFTGHKMAIGY